MELGGGRHLDVVSTAVSAVHQCTGRHHLNLRSRPQVGMQNSTLGASLALMHFADPLTAAPCAVSACMHSVIGSLLASYWQWANPEASPNGESKAIEGSAGIAA